MVRNVSLVLLALLMGCAPRRGRVSADWVVLGQSAVNDRLDHDIVAVGSSRGDFRRIKLTVSGASVDFYRVVVHFRNGRDQPVALQARIAAGGQSRSIDLDGGDRIIRSVEFWYDANTIRGRRAQVRVLGLP